MIDTIGRLVGRADELALLDEVLGGLEGGRGALLQVVGDPGIGKTRLLLELDRRAKERGHLVLAGRASELERDLPHSIFVDALDEYLRTLDRGWLGAVDRASEGELARIFPAVPRSETDRQTVLDERYRVHRAVRALLEELAEARPLVLLLDDLHWADPASVDLVGSLVRRPPRGKVLVAFALRRRQAPPRLAAALERDSGTLVRVELGALSEPEVAELLGDGVTAAAARSLHEESGGNPFYLDQLVRVSGHVAGPNAEGDGLAGGARLPPVVAMALASELADLPDTARALLDAAAVAGDPFEIELAVAAAETTEPEALVALDMLLNAALLHPTDVPRRFRFRHPILRRAVYDATGAAWRHGAHRRVAQALADHGAPPASRAHHVEQFASPGDRDAIRLFTEAADASAQRAPASAARWYRAALRLLPRGEGEADERAELLGRLAGVSAGVGQYDESHAALLELLDVLSREAPARRLQATAACAGVEHLLGRHDAAHGRLVQALAGLEEQVSADGAGLMLDLAMDGYFGADYDRMHMWGERALEIAVQLGEPPLTAAAHAVVCLGDAYGDRIPSALVHHAEAQRLVDALDDLALVQRLDALANLGGAEIYLGLCEEAVSHAKRGLALGRATGQGGLYPLLTQELGVALGILGRLEEAKEHLGGAIEAARLVGSSQGLSWSLVNSAWTAMFSGDLDSAVRLAEESAELVRGLDDSPISTWSAAVLGVVLVESGEPSRGIEVIRDGAGGPELTRIPGFFRVTVQARVTEALLALGRRDEAERAASHAAELAAATDLAMPRAQAAHAQAAVLLAAGDAQAAAVRALEGAAAADEIGARIDAARCRTLAGRALHAAGEAGRAGEVLTLAAETLDDCGAIRYRDEAERELRRLGSRRHRRRGARTSGDGLASLTARELEVARLVVDRRTNPEIAAELFLSRKTVETHLRNAFRKLDVSTRVELARAVERADRGS